MHATDSVETLRAGCRGLPPLDARLEPWMRALLGDAPTCDALVEQHGSPVNLHDFSALGRHATELEQAAAATGTDLRIFVARKANKTFGLVEAALERGLGVDVGSHRELSQVLDLGARAADVIVTAAVKPEPLLRLALDSRVTVALDSLDEAEALERLVPRGAEHPVAPRLAPTVDDVVAPTRFGEALETWIRWARGRSVSGSGLRLDGIHLHLHGYDAQARVRAIGEALVLVDALLELGHRPTFIDIGGGIPMSYLDDGEQWRDFLAALERGTASDAGSLTWRDEPLRQFYPYHQSVVRGRWLTSVLDGEVADGRTVAGELTRRSLQLRCEPGRSVLDGCGMTLARVIQTKSTSDGVPVVGLEMNRTQCRSTSDDFLVDPILVASAPDRSEAFSGFLVGAYCIEAELILRRRLAFPAGVGAGDLIAFPNTGGYLMHILESASHQLPLASNLVAQGDGFVQDGIDHVPVGRSSGTA